MLYSEVNQDVSRYGEPMFRICTTLMRIRILLVTFDADPAPTHFDANTDTDCHFDADPDPDSHFDADPDPNLQIKAQNLEKVLK